MCPCVLEWRLDRGPTALNRTQLLARVRTAGPRGRREDVTETCSWGSSSRLWTENVEGRTSWFNPPTSAIQSCGSAEAPTVSRSEGASQVRGQTSFSPFDSNTGSPLITTAWMNPRSTLCHCNVFNTSDKTFVYSAPPPPTHPPPFICDAGLRPLLFKLIYIIFQCQ